LDIIDRYIREIQAIRNYDALLNQNRLLKIGNAKLVQWIVGTEKRHASEFDDTIKLILEEMAKPEPKYPEQLVKAGIPDAIKLLIQKWWGDLPIDEKFSLGKLLQKQVEKTREELAKNRQGDSLSDPDE
jgi:hypothetical protein